MPFDREKHADAEYKKLECHQDDRDPFHVYVFQLFIDTNYGEAHYFTNSFRNVAPPLTELDFAGASVRSTDSDSIKKTRSDAAVCLAAYFTHAHRPARRHLDLVQERQGI